MTKNSLKIEQMRQTVRWKLVSNMSRLLWHTMLFDTIASILVNYKHVKTCPESLNDEIISKLNKWDKLFPEKAIPKTVSEA
jgi:hypothetical protein